MLTVIGGIPGNEIGVVTEPTPCCGNEVYVCGGGTA